MAIDSRAHLIEIDEGAGALQGPLSEAAGIAGQINGIWKGQHFRLRSLGSVELFSKNRSGRRRARVGAALGALVAISFGLIASFPLFKYGAAEPHTQRR